jgi:adenylate cyclase
MGSSHSGRSDRKLTAIMSADVFGYSRLMGADERDTFERLSQSRQVIFGFISGHRGRVANTAGDSILAEFASVEDAVWCSLEVQQKLGEMNSALPDDRKMQFRIGINLGDVFKREGDLFGDGVNVAARIQSLADPGGICVSRSVHDQVSGLSGVSFRFLGEQQVKNIARPVGVYKVMIGTPPEKESSPVSEIGDSRRKTPRTFTVAVMPFDNLSSDPEQAYFCDGLVEDLTTGLASIKGLDIPARNTMLAFKGKAVDVRQLGKELGATHVVEGSARKAGNRIRINVQLIDASNGNHVWAMKYDKDLTDIFDVQDEIVKGIVTELDVRLASGEQARSWRRTTRNPEAYDLFLQASAAMLDTGNRSEYEGALALLDRALALDPGFATALYARAQVLWGMVAWFAIDPPETMKTALALVDRAIELDPDSGEAMTARASILGIMGRDREAEEAFSRAFVLDPRLPNSYMDLASFREDRGRFEEALVLLDKADALARTIHPNSIHNRIMALCELGRLEEAKTKALHGVELYPRKTILWANLAVVCASLGLEDEAAGARDQVFKLDPGYRRSIWATRDPDLIAHLKKNCDAAGLPWILVQC